MAEILGDFQSLEFSQYQKDFVLYAKSNYVNQLLNSKESTKNKVMAIYDLLDSINKERINKAQEKPSCKKGCAHCCYIQVAATEWEIDVILEWMKHHNLEFTNEEIQHIKNQALIKNDKEYIISPHRKCVFLQPNNECGIYEVRPSACRNYYVYNDPKECDTFNPNAIGRTLVDFDLNTVPPILALMETSKMDSMPKHLIKKLEK